MTRRSIEEVARELHLKLNHTRPGRQYTPCPLCSHKRKKKNDRCAGVDIQDDGIVFFCNHCYDGNGGFYDTQRHGTPTSNFRPARHVSGEPGPVSRGRGCYGDLQREARTLWGQG